MPNKYSINNFFIELTCFCHFNLFRAQIVLFLHKEKIYTYIMFKHNVLHKRHVREMSPVYSAHEYIYILVSTLKIVLSRIKLYEFKPHNLSSVLLSC